MGCRLGSRIRKSIIATISPKRPHDGEHRSESRAERRLRCAVFLPAAVRSEPRESLRPPVGRSARVAQADVCGTKMESVPTPRGELEASRAVAQALLERLGVESVKTAFSAWRIRSFPCPSKENSVPTACILERYERRKRLAMSPQECPTCATADRASPNWSGRRRRFLR